MCHAAVPSHRPPPLSQLPPFTPCHPSPPQVKRARAKQLSPDEYNSGTFTISNLGMFGVESFDAILPPGAHSLMAPCACLPAVRHKVLLGLPASCAA